MNTAFLIGFIALQVADGVTTAMILARGGRELNPAVRWMIEKLGARTALAAAKVIAIIAFALILDHVPWSVLAGLCALYVVVCANNLRVLKNAKG